jgi:collagen type III alpha
VDSGGTKGKELSMSGEVSIGKGGSENSRQADGGNGKNIFQRVETAGVVSRGLSTGGVSNIGSVGGVNSRGKGNGRNIFQRAEMAGVVSGELSTGGVSNVGSVGNNDFGRLDKGTRFLSVVESVNAGSKQDRGSAGKMGDTGEGQVAMEQASMVKSRGSSGMGDDSMDKGAMSTLSPV